MITQYCRGNVSNDGILRLLLFFMESRRLGRSLTLVVAVMFLVGELSAKNKEKEALVTWTYLQILQTQQHHGGTVDEKALKDVAGQHQRLDTAVDLRLPRVNSGQVTMVKSSCWSIRSYTPNDRLDLGMNDDDDGL